MSSQKPTVSRVVHFHREHGAEPEAAIISKVHSDGRVNLHVAVDHEYHPWQRFCNIPFAEDGAARTWSWPPREGAAPAAPAVALGHAVAVSETSIRPEAPETAPEADVLAPTDAHEVAHQEPAAPTHGRHSKHHNKR